MSRKIMTYEELNNKIFSNTLNTCEYISGYVLAQNAEVTLRCIVHDFVFNTKYENVRRNNRKRHICPKCKEQDLQNRKIHILCDYCGEVAPKKLSSLKNGRTGHFFCSRTCKDMAQRIQSGEEFKKMRPDFYGDEGETIYNYRRNALEAYPHECEICKFNEDVDILDVHHIDENRQNNVISNLIVLCPTCHAKLTRGKYYLDRKNNKIIKKV